MFTHSRAKWFFTICLVFLFATVATAEKLSNNDTQPFEDLTNHPAAEEIIQLYRHGVVHDNENKLFYPDAPITRDELISMMVRAKKIDPVLGQQRSSFSDISQEDWIFPYAEIAYRLGITHGTRLNGQLVFQPQREVQQQEFIIMLLGAMGKGGRINELNWSTTMQTLNGYDDGNQVEPWAQRPMVFALQRQIISPEPDGLQPTRLVTKGEAARAIYKWLLLPTLEKQINDQADLPTFHYVRTLQVQTTAYHDIDTHSHAFIGWPTRVGTVAVDPNVIKLGSHLYIEGYGYAVAADIGGEVKQHHVDLFMPTLQQAKAHGLQQDVRVYVLD